MYEKIQYYTDILTKEFIGIRIENKGVTSFVPLDPANTDYTNIMKLVEEGKLVIAEPDSETK